ALRKAPPQIAETIAKTIVVPDGAAIAEAAGGYVNFRLTAEWLQRLVAEVAKRGRGYGAADMGSGEGVQVEFGSINPTGPMHIGHGRGVILGDSMSRLLEFTAHRAEREYYDNAQTTQARRFGASVWARMHGEEPPEGGYTGAYVTDLAEMAKRDLGDLDSQPEEEAMTKVRQYAIAVIVEQLRASVSKLNVRYDEWFPESRLWELGLPQVAIERLRESGLLKEREGALWFGEADDEEEDRVVIRSNGEPTYFASDLGYLLSRFEQRHFHRVVEVWASDN